MRAFIKLERDQRNDAGTSWFDVEQIDTVSEFKTSTWVGLRSGTGAYVKHTAAEVFEKLQEAYEKVMEWE